MTSYVKKRGGEKARSRGRTRSLPTFHGRERGMVLKSSWSPETEILRPERSEGACKGERGCICEQRRGGGGKELQKKTVGLRVADSGKLHLVGGDRGKKFDSY